MREILCRGKKICGECCEGNLIISGGKCFISGAPYSIGKIYDAKDIEVAFGGFHPVIPSTVGQYTGLIDKNGRKIFEGDIIEFPDHGNGGTKTGQIKYFDDETMFLIVYEENNCKPLGECFHGLQLEVIGNIHDNPELLEANE